MSAIEQAKRQLAAHGALLEGVTMLRDIVKHALVDTSVDAYKILQMIEKGFDVLISSFDDKASHAEVDKHLRELETHLRALPGRLGANDAAADRALDEKFGGGSDV